MNYEKRSEISSSENRSYSRRDAFRLSVGVVATAGSAVLLDSLPIDDYVQKETGIRSGNAAYWQRKDACENKLDECSPVQDIALSDKLRVMSIEGILGPLWEELIFRKIPSDILDKSKKTSNDFRLTRREALVGGGTSIAFGLAHNVGVMDTSTIPTSQTIAGGVFWYLQRKFGFAANFCSHAAGNLYLNFKEFF